MKINLKNLKTATKIELGLLIVLAIVITTFMVDVSIINKQEAIQLSGKSIQKTIQLDSFSGIELNDYYDVVYEIGEPKVVIETDQIFEGLFLIEQNDNLLKLDLKEGSYQNMNIYATIYGPADINLIQMNDRSSLSSNIEFNNEHMTIYTNYQSDADITINAKTVNIRQTSHSELTLKGSSDVLNYEGHQYAELKGKYFNVKHANIDADNHTKGTLNITESLKGTFQRYADWIVNGNPKNVNVTKRRTENLKINESE